jgi:hypothetical protein
MRILAAGLLGAHCMVAWVVPSRAQDASQCFAFGDVQLPEAMMLSQVKDGRRRVRFVSDECPDPKTCTRGPFVVPGDLVLIEQVFDETACAVFVNAKGDATYGLLENERLEAPSESVVEGPRAFLGSWVRTEAEITVTEDGGGLRFEGSATFGALDPERVASGGVNTGEFSVLAEPSGSRFDFAVSQDQTGEAFAVAATEAGEFDCAIAMEAVGPYLVVSDNRRCGGNNVSFTGVYRRADR